MYLSRAVVLAMIVTAFSATATHAAPESCRGLPPTIVGTPGGSVNGTDGDDVIVTNGASSTHAGAGDDTVCVTGAGDTEVYAEDGDDVVDSSQSESGALVELGAGDDTFVGGPKGESVRPGPGTDDVSTAGGPDGVTSDERGVNHDDLDLGSGWGRLTLASERNDGTLVLGPESELVLRMRQPDHWVVDAAAGTVTLAGDTMTTWTGRPQIQVVAKRDTLVAYLGTPDDDVFHLYGGFDGARLGAGNDQISLDQKAASGQEADGGPGVDQLAFSGDRLDVDLGRGLVTPDHRSPVLVAGFESYRLSADRITVLGSRRADEVRTDACHATVYGRAGNDRLLSEWNPTCWDDGPHSLSISGEGGDDLIGGSAFDDHLDGGPGEDEIYGRIGRDWCHAEVEHGCERP